MPGPIPAVRPCPAPVACRAGHPAAHPGGLRARHPDGADPLKSCIRCGSQYGECELHSRQPGRCWTEPGPTSCVPSWVGLGGRWGRYGTPTCSSNVSATCCSRQAAPGRGRLGGRPCVGGVGVRRVSPDVQGGTAGRRRSARRSCTHCGFTASGCAIPASWPPPPVANRCAGWWRPQWRCKTCWVSTRTPAWPSTGSGSYWTVLACRRSRRGLRRGAPGGARKASREATRQAWPAAWRLVQYRAQALTPAT